MNDSIKNPNLQITAEVGETGRLLDGFLLLANGGFGLPDDAVDANLSSLDIVEVSDDLRFFPNLDKLDLSDNRLNYKEVIEHIFVAPRLTQINLSCNQIAAMNCRRNPTHYQSCFYTLTHLDLSFNELHGDVLISLAALPKLESLNLSANCVSSIPPEESLEGFFNLEELILDSNDLVQFDQWRSLDCIPKLKKLGLASNRIRRLKDDIPHANDIFTQLEELDLRFNEIPELDALSLVLAFSSLKKIQLSNTDFPDKYENINLVSCRIPSWYMQGNGSFAARYKNKAQKERPKRAFRAVNTDRPKNQNTGDPLLTYGRGGQDNINQNLKNTALINSNEALQQALYADTVHAANEASMKQGGFLEKYRIPPVDLTECDEDELDEIFRNRRILIDKVVDEMVSQEPVKNFMKPIPFALSEHSSVRATDHVKAFGADQDAKTFMTQHDGQVDPESFFARFTEEELLQTPRTPLELRQQQALQNRLEARRENEQSAAERPPVVDVPIDVRRSLEALRDAMNRGDEI